jgi:hypothetical protein
VIKQAAQLGAMLAPMILQEVQAGGGGEEEMAPQEAQPVFKGGKFVGTILSNFKYTLKLVPFLSNDEAGVSLLSY